MGFTPREVDQMSVGEFVACVDGWNRANGGESKKKRHGDMEEADLRAMGVEGF